MNLMNLINLTNLMNLMNLMNQIILKATMIIIAMTLKNRDKMWNVNKTVSDINQITAF